MNLQLLFTNLKLDSIKKISSLPVGLKQAGFMFIASSLVGALNYLVHFATSRMLGPTEYGVFASLNSFYTLVYTPLGILTFVTAYYLAQFQARGEDHRSSSLFNDITKWVAIIGMVLGIVIAISSPLLADFLQIPSSIPILIVAITIWVASLVSVFTGALQGLQKFYALGSISVVSAFLRLTFAIGLVALGLHASGALAAQFFSLLVAIALALIILTPVLRRHPTEQRVKHGLSVKEIISYAGLVLVGTTCFAALTNMDVMIVKHYFPPAAAGQYAAASVLAKVILYFPAAITAVLLPKATERFTLQKDTSKIARQAVAAVAGLCGCLVVVFFLFPNFMIQLLFGQGYEAAVPLLGPFGLTMALYALVTVQMTYYLSIHKSRYIPLIAGSTILVIVALVLFHNSLLEVIIIQMINAAALLVVGELVLRGILIDIPRLKIRKKTGNSQDIT